MNNNHFKFLCMQFCEKYRGKTFGEVIPNIFSKVTDYEIHFEECHFGNYNFNHIEFRIDFYSIFIFRDNDLYIFNKNKKTQNIDLTDLVGEMNDIV